MAKGKIAFLVAAHTDPAMVARLACRLLPYGEVFVHVDGKVPLDPFRKALPAEATLLENRIRVSWGGWTQVQATLALMETARRAMPDGERFMLLSGQDYPIRSLDEFTAMLDARPGHEFIRAFEMLPSDHDRPKVQFKRRLDDVIPYRFAGPFGKATAFLNRLVRKIDREISPYRERRYPFEMVPATGSSWWVLTREAVDYLLTTIRKDPRLARFYRNTFAVDEQIFHTLVHNSPLAGKADPLEPYRHQQIGEMANVHLIDNSLGKTFRLDDLDEILASQKWFLRKVTTAESTPLLDRLDELAGA